VAALLVEYTTELSTAVIWQIELLPNNNIPKQAKTYLESRLNGINSVVIILWITIQNMIPLSKMKENF